MTKITRKQIDDDLYNLLRTIYHYEKLLENKTGLDFQKMYLLLHLYQKPPLRLTDIAHELNIPMFSASRLVDSLVEKKLIKKVQEIADRRSIAISIEPAGVEMINELEEKSYKKVLNNFSEFNEADFEIVIHLVKKLHQILEVTDQVNKKPQS